MPTPTIPSLPGSALSLEELELYHLLMDYRAENGLPPIELSAALTATAGYHAHDTLYNIWDAGLTLPPGANLHSWSDAPYFADHSQAEVMWYAPERYGIAYPSPGYEISAAGYQSIEQALAGWQGSPGHNQVILNLDIWADVEFLAVGVGLAHDPAVATYGGNIYHVWFGETADPAGPPMINGTAESDVVRGTAFDDFVTTGDGADTIHGGAGDDTLTGGEDDDVVGGGVGDDHITSSVGSDLISGDQGDDVVILTGSTYHTSGYVAFNVSSDAQIGTQARITLEGLVRIEAVTDGGAGADIVQLSDEGDAFFLHDAYSGFHGALALTEDYVGNQSAARFANIEEIRGMGGHDIIDLTSPDYSLAGVAMAIDGGDGDDVIWGSDANENISGGTGNDTLFGGIGADVLTGGLGADVFEFTRSSTDTSVTDFDVEDGDMLRFYNAGGAEFIASSVALTGTGITISYTETAFGTEKDISIPLATSAAEFTATLLDIQGTLEII